jgi:diaminopimelate epimerase
VRFAKYHGLGNDFVLVDRRGGGGAALAAAAVRALCDRHRGIGADGVLSLLAEPARPQLLGRMQVQNADGSDAEVCGNGLRCLARFAYDEAMLPPSVAELSVAAGERVYRIERQSAARYRVHLGEAVLAHADLPPLLSGTNSLELAAGERRFAVTPVHVGNPHAVIFTDEPPAPLAAAYGPAIEGHAAFPRHANVSFARALAAGAGFEAAVFERGAGLTQACGSGACAIVAAAVARGLVPRGLALEVRLPGGSLTVAIDADGQLVLEGEAVRVFSGEVGEP